MKFKVLDHEPVIVNGWLQDVMTVPSPNYNARPDNEISLLVIHNISLPPGKFGGDYVEKFFTGCLPVDEDPYFESIKDGVPPPIYIVVILYSLLFKLLSISSFNFSIYSSIKLLLLQCDIKSQ